MKRVCVNKRIEIKIIWIVFCGKLLYEAIEEIDENKMKLLRQQKQIKLKLRPLAQFLKFSLHLLALGYKYLSINSFGLVGARG